MLVKDYLFFSYFGVELLSGGEEFLFVRSCRNFKFLDALIKYIILIIELAFVLKWVRNCRLSLAL